MKYEKGWLLLKNSVWLGLQAEPDNNRFLCEILTDCFGVSGCSS